MQDIKVSLPDGEYCNDVISCPFLSENGECSMLHVRSQPLVIRWADREGHRKWGNIRPLVKHTHCPARKFK